MLTIPNFWFWLVEIVLFGGISIYLLLSEESAPWWVWLGVAGAFIILALLVWANIWLRQQDQS